MPAIRFDLTRCAGALLPVLLCGLALAAAGCRPAPTITAFTEKAPAEDEDALEPDLPEPATNGERILGAYVPGPKGPGGADAWWVFKLRGRPNTVGKREEDFDLFLASLQIPQTAGALPAWKLPKGWRIVPATDKISVLNIRTSHPLTPVDITLSNVGGTLVENINRWQAQVGQAVTPEEDLPKTWREMKTADGKPIYRVDLKGPGGKPNAMMAPFAK